MLHLYRCYARGTPCLCCPSKSEGEEGKLAARSPGLDVKNMQDGLSRLPARPRIQQSRPSGHSILYLGHMTSIILISRCS